MSRVDRERAWAWAACLGVVALTAARLAAPGPQLLGDAGAEVYGHAWVQGWAASSWPSLPATTDLLGDTTPWRVIDPGVTWIAAGLGRALGPVFAYDAMVLAAVAGAFWGGWWLAGRVGGHRLTGAVVLSLGPAFLGSAASGLTEDLALGLLAAALAGVGRGGWWRAALTGALLGLLAWAGLYLALMGALGAVALGAVALAERPAPGDTRRARLGRLALTAGVAAALVVPAAGLQGERLTGVRHRSGAPVTERVEAHWRVNPARGADLASLVVPGPDRAEDGALIRLHPAYLGWVVLGLAGVAGRRGRGWWVVLGLALVLMPGPELRVLGHPTGLAWPVVGAAQGVPVLGLVNHWGRFGLLALVALAALSSLGATRLGEHPRWGRATAWLPLAVALEYALLSPAPVPLPVTDASVPAIHASLDGLPSGAVVVVPSGGPGVQHQRPLYRQRGHGRPLMVHPNRPGYGRAEAVPLVRWFASLPGERRDPPPPRVEASWAMLADLGVGVILVEDPWVADVEALLGPPDLRSEGGAAWGVER